MNRGPMIRASLCSLALLLFPAPAFTQEAPAEFPQTAPAEAPVPAPPPPAAEPVPTAHPPAAPVPTAPPPAAEPLPMAPPPAAPLPPALPVFPDYSALDHEGRTVVAVVVFAGEDPEVNRRFHEGTMEAVAALPKYQPRGASPTAPSAELPTDMPPNQDLAAGARYAITGGVYPGNRLGDYYLQLWLWDMSGSTMIYTDDLVYVDIDAALASLPGLVEWLFSHIREVTIEAPEPELVMDPFFMLGLRTGLAQRWYRSAGEISPSARALAVEGSVSGAVRLNPLLALQLELSFTGDNHVDRGLIFRQSNSRYPDYQYQKFTSLSLSVPVILKVNFRAGSARFSPLGGLYALLPLGQAHYRETPEGQDAFYAYSSRIIAGFTAGLEAALNYGPGKLLAGLRYAADFNNLVIRDAAETSYRRNMFSLYLGYELGFFNTQN